MKRLSALGFGLSALVPLVLSAQAVAITGARVFTMAGAPIENGTVLIRDGRIVQVGTNVAVPADARRIDGAGKWVTPGLINAATQLGLVDVGGIL